MKLLEPYAKEMAEPLFALENPTVVSLKEGPKVSKYRFMDTVNGIDGVLFPFRGQKVLSEIELVCGTLSINRWRDRVSLQMDIEYME